MPIKHVNLLMPATLQGRIKYKQLFSVRNLSDLWPFDVISAAGTSVQYTLTTPSLQAQENYMGETNELFLLGCAASVSLETGTIIIFQFRLASPRKHALLRHQFSQGLKALQDPSKLCNGLTCKIEKQKVSIAFFRHFHLPVFKMK